MSKKKINTVCIIDDDPIFIYGAKRSMVEVDFCDAILIYNNGEEAIKGLNKMTMEGGQLPNLILLDLNMPIMSGWEFLEEFTKTKGNSLEKTIIYITSSSINPVDLKRAKMYNSVSNYILKPITSEDLISIFGAVA